MLYKRVGICILMMAVLLNFDWTTHLSSVVNAAPLPTLAAVSPDKAVTGIAATIEETAAVNDSSPEQEHLAKAGTKRLLPKQTLAHLQVSLEQFIQVFYWRMVALDANSAKLPYDVAHAMNRLSFGNGVLGFAKMVGLLIVVFLLAGGAEYIFRRFILSRFAWKTSAVSHNDGWLQFWIFLLQRVPDILALLFFVAASYAFYVIVYANYFSGLCPIYLSLLTAIVSARTVSLILRLFIDPRENNLTLLGPDKKTATLVSSLITAGAWIVFLGIMSIALLKHAGVHGDSLLLLKLSFGTLLCLLAACAIWLNRTAVARLIVGTAVLKKESGVKESLAANWYLMGLGYLFLLWALWIIRLIVAGPKFALAFVVSLFIVPIFLVLDRMANWFFLSQADPEIGEIKSETGESDEAEQPPLFLGSLRLVFRILLTALLFVWLLDLWGYPIAISPHIFNMATQAMVIIGAAFLIWKIIDIFIRNHLANKALAQAEEEDVDSEWGDAPLLDRSQTLLPLVRKFTTIGITIMTVLFILSTLGVNIGPLLAGAGVVGIAIGFGAQKLVSDIFSGFFYLMDDAFRVGEYIEAGSISGAVEKITLRNVMLRHHRGMLQIVPYSDLGAITNFMRGGIVVKFNLQFPYDTNVDVVRKVIKKVGIAMLDDPEFGKNFIKQVKSQGIREVGDSILTIMVKFTAQPGTHFVIRREAYRRITEALAAKGIYYAHRKVIVEVPSLAEGNGHEDPSLPMSDEAKQQIAQAGAAAYQVQQGSSGK